MQLTKLHIKNFRLIKNATLKVSSRLDLTAQSSSTSIKEPDVNAYTTLIVGRNNSAKTSCMEFLRRVLTVTHNPLGEEIDHPFSFDDYPLSLRSSLYSNFRKFLAQECDLDELKCSIPTPSLTFTVDYSQEGNHDDLGALADFIVNLEPEINTAKIRAEYVLGVTEHELTNKREIKVSTMAGTLTLKLNSDDSVTVNMGKPVLELSKIPVANVQGEPLYPLVLENKEYLFFPVSMGNPHAVFFVDEILEDEFFKVGKALQDHEFFPEKVNVEFAVQKDPNSFEVRVFERGCGETLACGTGACAVAVAALERGLCHGEVEINLKGGKLRVNRNSAGEVMMTGPATTVYEGTIEI